MEKNQTVKISGTFPRRVASDALVETSRVKKVRAAVAAVLQIQWDSSDKDQMVAAVYEAIYGTQPRRVLATYAGDVLERVEK